MRPLATVLATVTCAGLVGVLPVNDVSIAQRVPARIDAYDQLAGCLAQEIAGPGTRYAFVTATAQRLFFLTVWQDRGATPLAQLRIAETVAGQREISLNGSMRAQGPTLNIVKAAADACRLRS